MRKKGFMLQCIMERKVNIKSFLIDLDWAEQRSKLKACFDSENTSHDGDTLT